MMKRAYTLVEFLVTVGILVLIVAVAAPYWIRAREAATPPQCTSRLKQIGLGFLQYSQDYDDRFPRASVAWPEALQPYLKSWEVLQCDADRSDVAQTTDYFFNARMAAVQQKDIRENQFTILAGDGQPNRNTSPMLSQLPDAWRANPNSPAWRHPQGANYLFADGHVKRLSPAQIADEKPAKEQPTFLVKP